MENGFIISNNKTKCMDFCQIHKIHNQPALILNGNEIPITYQYKFLGITLDPKLSFISHIKWLRIKCDQTVQFLRTIAHTDCGVLTKTPNQTIQMFNMIKTWLWLFHIQQPESSASDNLKPSTTKDSVLPSEPSLPLQSKAYT